MLKGLGALVVSVWIAAGVPGQELLVVDGKRDLLPLDSWAATERAMFVDFDADGRLDVVCDRIGIGWPQPLVFRGTGGGRFTSIEGSPDDWLSLEAAADLDGDGSVELILDGGSLARIDGAGQLVFASVQLGSGPAAVGDVDGDGDLDVVRAPRGGMELWLQDAPLTFRRDARLAGAGGAAVALNDLEGDGDLDILVARAAAADGLFLGDGHGGFVAADNRLPGVVRETQRCVFEDLDGDGACDVMFLDGSPGGGRLLLQRGGVLVDHSAQLGLPPGLHVDVVAGDVSGDGRVDLVVASNPGGVVLRGMVGGWFLPMPGAFPAGRANSSIDLGDVDGDGDLDLLEASRSATARVHLNDGTGRFIGPSSRHQRLAVRTPLRESYVALDDFDGDGDADVVTPGSFWRNDGFGSFDLQASDAPAAAESMAYSALATVAVGDVDGDGHVDLVLPSTSTRFRVHHGRGDGRFVGGAEYQAPIDAPGQPWEVPQFVGVLRLHDLDADGDLDLVCGAMRGNVMQPSAVARDSVWRNDGTGAFADDPAALDLGTQVGNDVAFGDLDGDGRVDFSDGYASFLQRPDGSFARIEPDPSSSLWSAYRVAVKIADLDGDGDLDVACASACLGTPQCEGERDVLGWNDGQGRLIRAYASSFEEESAGVAVLDVDDDLVPDLLFVHKDLGSHGRAVDYLHRGDGQGGFGAAELCGSWRDSYVVLTADLDGDGDLDVLTLDESPDSVEHEPLVMPRWNLARHLLAPDLLRAGSDYPLELYGGMQGGAILMSPFAARLPVPPFGVLGMQPDATVVLRAFGPLSSGRVHRHALRCPDEPSLVGMQFVFQGLTAGARGDLRLTGRVAERVLAR